MTRAEQLDTFDLLKLFKRNKNQQPEKWKDFTC